MGPSPPSPYQSVRPAALGALSAFRAAGQFPSVRRPQRVENNGWRPISHRVLSNPDDPISRYTAARRMVFHPIPSIRRGQAGCAHASKPPQGVPEILEILEIS